MKASHSKFTKDNLTPDSQNLKINWKKGYKEFNILSKCIREDHKEYEKFWHDLNDNEKNHQVTMRGFYSKKILLKNNWEGY